MIKDNSKKVQKKLKVKSKGKSKYDWGALKQEYFESDFLECFAFFKSKYGRFDGNMSKKSRGWPKEKKIWRNAEVEMALQNLQKDRISNLKHTLDKIVVLAKNEIDAMAKKGIKVKSLVKLWEVIRTEAGLPKAVTRNVNENTIVDLSLAKQSLLDKVNKK